MLDGTLLSIDRGMTAGADRPYYSGKHECHGLNVHVLVDPAGRLIWALPALPGSRHDIAAVHDVQREVRGLAGGVRVSSLRPSAPSVTDERLISSPTAGLASEADGSTRALDEREQSSRRVHHVAARVDGRIVAAASR